MIDLLRLTTDLGRLSTRLERTDPTAAITLQNIIRRLNEGTYVRQETPVGEAVSEVAKRF